MRHDLVGKRLAHFRILEMLGEGGMGKVFRARDEKLERDVALKVIHEELSGDEHYRRRLMREAKAAAAASHARIATVYEVGEADDILFIAMEWVAGCSLAETLEAGPLASDRAARIARDIARALTKAHEAGVVHRDLKPDNVMLEDDGGVKVLDFGIARREKPRQQSDTQLAEAETAITAEGAVIGTPGYMSPEQALGLDLDQRTDVFSLGVLLYETLTGQRPFGGASLMEAAIAVTRDAPDPITDHRDVPEALTEIVERCLEKDPNDRYQTARELAEALDDAATAAESSEPVRTGPRPRPAARADTTPRPAAPTSPPARRSAVWLLAIGTLLATAVGINELGVPVLSPGAGQA